MAKKPDKRARKRHAIKIGKQNLIMKQNQDQRQAQEATPINSCDGCGKPKAVENFHTFWADIGPFFGRVPNGRVRSYTFCKSSLKCLQSAFDMMRANYESLITYSRERYKSKRSDGKDCVVRFPVELVLVEDLAGFKRFETEPRCPKCQTAIPFYQDSIPDFKNMVDKESRPQNWLFHNTVKCTNPLCNWRGCDCELNEVEFEALENVNENPED